jgi:hypothetical protein
MGSLLAGGFGAFAQAREINPVLQQREFDCGLRRILTSCFEATRAQAVEIGMTGAKTAIPTPLHAAWGL